MTHPASPCLTMSILVAAAALALGPGAGPAAAQSTTCPEATPTYTGPCGPTFVLPGWGDAGGWTDPEQYETIQLADVDGDGADELLARTPGGVAIHVFDKTLGQWRPQVDAKNVPTFLTQFADPPPLTTANPNPPGTDWKLPQYYDTIQAADIDGQKGEEILGRGASGLIVFKFTPGASPGQGSWRQLTTSGPFTDADGWDTGPFNYATIQTGDINGDGDAEVIGRNAQGLYAFNWTGSSWSQLALFSDLGDKGGFNDPRYWPSIQLADIDGDRRAELLARDASGLSAYRFGSGGWTKISRFPEPFSDLSGGEDCPFTSPGSTCFGTGPAYYGTIQFADVDGDGRKELVGRASDGLRVRRYRGDTPDGWGRLATLSDLSDANGYTAQKYWETIQFADIDGDHRAELLARDQNGLNAWGYNPSQKAWTKLQPATALRLTDDPWGSDRSYYSTIQTGDVDGDGSADVVARGPYGIRTWFYSRTSPGGTTTPGWERYLPEGYQPFPGGEAAAFAELNTLAGTVRGVYTSENPPAQVDLTNLQTRLVNVGGCKNPQPGPVPQYGTCDLPPGSSGFNQTDWTKVLNTIFEEIFWAGQVVAHFHEGPTSIQDAKQWLFLEDNAQLPSIANDLSLAAAANASAQHSFKELFGSMLGIAGAIAGAVPEPGEVVAAPLDIAAELLSMLPSASETFTSTFQGTYAQLQTTFANSIDEVDKALDEHSQLVRGDPALLTLVGQLRARGTWALDVAGMKSAGRQGFALSMYRTFLPILYARYVVSGCANRPTVIFCSQAPPTGPSVVGSANNFTVVGPPPTRNGLGAPSHPCVHQQYDDLCSFDAVPAPLGPTVWGPVSARCAYQPGNAGTEWVFSGCDLGVDPQKSVVASSVPSENWAFPTYTGTPGIFPPASSSLKGSAGALGGKETVRLTGRVAVPRSVRIRRASIVQDRLLHEPQGAGELVRRRSGARLPPLKLSRRRGRGVRHLFVSRSRHGPLTRLRLWRSSRRTLSFDLRLRGARLTLPAACSGMRPGVDLATSPITLHTRLRIDDGRRRPLVISLRPQWQCRRNRLGAVNRLVVRQPKARPPRRGSLAVALRGPRRARIGGVAIYRIDIRNRRRDTAYDVRVRALLPSGFRPLRGGGARSGGRQTVWRLRSLPPGRSRTLRLRARIAPAAARRRCPVILAEALDTRPGRARVCTRIRR